MEWLSNEKIDKYYDNLDDHLNEEINKAQAKYLNFSKNSEIPNNINFNSKQEFDKSFTENSESPDPNPTVKVDTLNKKLKNTHRTFNKSLQMSNNKIIKLSAENTLEAKNITLKSNNVLAEETEKSGVEIPTYSNSFGSRFIVANCTDTVEGKINILLDSGSECSLIRSNVLSNRVPIFEQFQVQISGIENGNFNSLGMCLLLLRFKRKFILQEFQVVEDKFLESTNALISLKK